jgi:hypothetical protein
MNSILADCELLDLIEHCEKGRGELDAIRHELDAARCELKAAYRALELAHQRAVHITDNSVLPALDAAADYLADLRERGHTSNDALGGRRTRSRRSTRASVKHSSGGQTPR